MLWSRAGALPAPESIGYSVPGHTWADGKQGPRLQVRGTTLIEDGAEYVVPLTHLVKGGMVSHGGWAPLTGASVLAVDDVVRQGAPGWVVQAKATTVDELVAAVRDARPHPGADLSDPDPRQRWEQANRSS